MSAPGPAESTEARLLAIALRHFRRDGAARTTVVRIAEEAGMTHANVYRYFPSKAALGERIVGDWLRGIELKLADIVQAPDPADDKLERFLTLLARAYEEKAAGDPAIFAMFAEAAAQRTAQATRHRTRLRDLMRQVLEEGQSTRVFGGGEIKRLERLVLDVVHRFIDPQAVAQAVRQGRTRGDGSFDSRRDRVVRLLLRGLGGLRS